MPMTRRGAMKPAVTHRDNDAPFLDFRKTSGHPNIRDGHAHTRHLTNPQEHRICDCENPEPESGVALLSNECDIHNLYPRPSPERKNSDGVKVGGLDWNDRTRKGQAFNTHAERMTLGTKNGGTTAWFSNDKMLGRLGPAKYGSKSSKRKAASALIAKIPLVLARHIAKVYFPLDNRFESAAE